MAEKIVVNEVDQAFDPKLETSPTVVEVEEKYIQGEGDEEVVVAEPMPEKPKRLLSLDALRGLTIILMITANYQTINPFPQISHAEWFGFTIADLVFPAFVFVMGLAIPLALSSPKLNGWRLWYKLIKRSVLLWAFGAFLNGFPFANPELSTKYRFVGVLHRLSLCYLVTASFFALCRNAAPKSFKYIYINYLFPLVALVIWLAITFGLDVPECGRGSLTPECSAEGYIDTALWGRTHNYQGKNFDPEGFLSMIPACITCWLGMKVGMHISQNRAKLTTVASKYQKISQFLLLSLLFLFIAYAFDPIIPVGKPLWTPTFVLTAAGFTTILLSILMYLIDIKNLLENRFAIVRFIFKSMLKVGSNPLLIYMMSEILLGIVYSIVVPWDGRDNEDGYLNLWSVIYFAILSKWIPDSLGSMIYSQIFIWCFYVPIAWALDYKGWYLRV